MASYISGWVLKFVFMTHPFEPINFISEVFLHPLIHHKVGEMVDELNLVKFLDLGNSVYILPVSFLFQLLVALLPLISTIPK